jgi:Nucleotidyltransferase domain
MLRFGCMSDPSHAVEFIIEAVLRWAIGRHDIRGVALVGSHARGNARRDSDIDLLILAEVPEVFRTDPSWLKSIDWRTASTRVRSWSDEDYGAVWSRRIWLEPDFELEVSFALLTWASTNPIDSDTQEVVGGGCRILHDPDGVLDRLCAPVERA